MCVCVCVRAKGASSKRSDLILIGRRWVHSNKTTTQYKQIKETTLKRNTYQNSRHLRSHFVGTQTDSLANISAAWYNDVSKASFAKIKH